MLMAFGWRSLFVLHGGAGARRGAGDRPRPQGDRGAGPVAAPPARARRSLRRAAPQPPFPVGGRGDGRLDRGALCAGDVPAVHPDRPGGAFARRVRARHAAAVGQLLRWARSPPARCSTGSGRTGWSRPASASSWRAASALALLLVWEPSFLRVMLPVGVSRLRHRARHAGDVDRRPRRRSPPSPARPRRCSASCRWGRGCWSGRSARSLGDPVLACGLTIPAMGLIACLAYASYRRRLPAGLPARRSKARAARRSLAAQAPTPAE